MALPTKGRIILETTVGEIEVGEGVKPAAQPNDISSLLSRLSYGRRFAAHFLGFMYHSIPTGRAI